MTASIRSPKNRYMIEVSFDKPLSSLGSVISFTSDSIDHLRSLISSYTKYAGLVRIFENKKTYPEFDWQIVEQYNIGK